MFRGFDQRLWFRGPVVELGEDRLQRIQPRRKRKSLVIGGECCVSSGNAAQQRRNGSPGARLSDATHLCNGPRNTLNPRESLIFLWFFRVFQCCKS
jgi:hypothetical protein